MELNQNANVSASPNQMMQYMSNPKAYTLKRWLSQILQQRMAEHENTIERVSISLVTQDDLLAFGKLATALFEVGYLKAVTDYRGQLEKLGVKISIHAEKPNLQSSDSPVSAIPK